MININTIIARIKSQTGYIVEPARFREPTLTDAGSVKIYVGYGTLRSSLANNDIAYNAYNLHGTDMLQTIDVQITCQVSEFYSVFKQVYKALNAWTPDSTELTQTSLAYEQGGVMGLDNGNIWHLDRYRVGFSTTSLL